MKGTSQAGYGPRGEAVSETPGSWGPWGFENNFIVTDTGAEGAGQTPMLF